VGVVNVPVVHYSVTWWNSLHQGSTILKMGKPSISMDMAIPLYAALIGSYLLAGYAILRRMQNDLLLRERRSTWVRELTAGAP
jgi:heme exporter protein C